MENKVFVYIDLQGTPHFVGLLWARTNRNGKESASFEYDKSWLESPYRFSLEPALELGSGPYYTEKALFGAFGDSAPDTWGRILMRRAERIKANKEGRTPRTLNEIDYLLLVYDESREGALRFAKQEGGPFLSHDNKIPPFLALPKLLSAVERFTKDKETEEDLKLLLAPGSSLGGARPKASLIDKDGKLAIAKFPSAKDEHNTVLWEAVALTLASMSKITVPEWRVELILKKPVLILKRFDRNLKNRIPYLSAMSMLAANDNEPRSYLEIADALRRYGSEPMQDLKQLWRRIVFNILIANTDDHLRNHGFLYEGETGWKLSPAFDLNPVPMEIKPRILTTFINFDDNTTSIDEAFSVIKYFHLSIDEAKMIVTEISEAISGWKTVAKKLGIKSDEMEKMKSAFLKF